jgi:hypothetical protein
MGRRYVVTARPVFPAKAKGNEISTGIDICVMSCIQRLLKKFQSHDSFVVESLSVTPISAADGTMIYVCVIGSNTFEDDDEDEDGEKEEVDFIDSDQDEED